MTYPRPYSADLNARHDSHIWAWTARTMFTGGQLYRATDGRLLFVMSGNSRTVDVWENTGVGQSARVGEMTCGAFATLIGR